MKGFWLRSRTKKRLEDLPFMLRCDDIHVLEIPPVHKYDQRNTYTALS